MQKPFLDSWVDKSHPNPKHANVAVFTEKTGSRKTVIPLIQQVVKDHLIGAEYIKAMGYPRAATIIKNKLPVYKQIRSGDLGEIIATEFVVNKTEFSVPLKRLRYKDDRNTSMRGTDVIGVHVRPNKPTRVLKAEVKSRKALRAATLKAATADLLKFSCRPNPSTLAFLSSRLRELGRYDEAEVFENLQLKEPSLSDIEHLVFTVSGNDPASYLIEFAKPPKDAAKRQLVGIVVDDHQAFIDEVFSGIK